MQVLGAVSPRLPFRYGTIQVVLVVNANWLPFIAAAASARWVGSVVTLCKWLVGCTFFGFVAGLVGWVLDHADLVVMLISIGSLKKR